MNFEHRIEQLEKLIERLIEREAPSHTGSTISGAAHGCKPIHEFDAWFRAHFMKNG